MKGQRGAAAAGAWRAGGAWGALLALVLGGAVPARAQEPDEPALPAGLDSGPPPEEEAPAGEPERLFHLDGFAEFRLGYRTGEDPHEKDRSIAETRLQLELEEAWRGFDFKLTSDFLLDELRETTEIDLERGRGWIDLREASVTFSPLDFLDVKLGRQILTWGTGDLVFLNDLFPKDWQAFFIGRDVEYLKAPSDALKLSFFSEAANLDVVATPRFDPDRFLTGERLSFFRPDLGRRAGRDAVLDPDIPDEWIQNGELALRLARNLSGLELAAYAYRGYWKSPAGFDPATGRPAFPKLSVYGASARGTIRGGVANVEAAYYDSREDRGGDDPLVGNSQFRLLMGYERQLPEVAPDLTAGVQYYLEWMLDHAAFERSLPPDAPGADELRHILTLRLTRLLLDQNLTLSLFGFWSLSDADAYLRPHVHYKIDDHWSAELGGNVFFGREDSTFFGQLEDDTNVFVALRYAW